MAYEVGVPPSQSASRARGGPFFFDQLSPTSRILAMRGSDGAILALFDELGKLILPGSATDPLHAVTKGEVILTTELDGAHAILATDGAGVRYEAPSSTNDVLARAGGNITWLSSAVSQWFGRTSAGNLGFQTMADLVLELLTAQSGSSFPGSPTDGQRFYHTTHDEWHTYSTADAGWLSDRQIKIFGSISGAATGYLWLDNVSIPYSSTVGFKFGYDVKVKEMHCFALSSSSCDYVVRSSGTNVTNAIVSLVAATTGYLVNIASGTISSGGAVALAVNAGTANGGSVVSAMLRPFRT